ncbi:MAG: hypothetical protein LBB21_04100 [Holosporaceae bacterium]|jgi:hypothetical protein|nr:hypothetical protein [Holosporaceae bacterium]
MGCYALESITIPSDFAIERGCLPSNVIVKRIAPAAAHVCVVQGVVVVIDPISNSKYHHGSSYKRLT